MWGVSEFINPIGYTPGLCYFGYYINNVLGLSQSVFMGFDQLPRLYYCFSESNVHSTKGYHSSLFYVMFVIGFILITNHVLAPIARGTISTSCEITNDHDTSRYNGS